MEDIMTALTTTIGTFATYASAAVVLGISVYGVIKAAKVVVRSVSVFLRG